MGQAQLGVVEGLPGGCITADPDLGDPSRPAGVFFTEDDPAW